MSRCLIIYKSYATCFPSGARETQWLSHHWSITIGVYLVWFTCTEKCCFTLFSHMLFALTASKI
jgi:hypothetical protein